MTSSGVILARAVDKWQPRYANQLYSLSHACTRKTRIDLSKMAAISLRCLVVLWIILSTERAVLGKFRLRLNVPRLLGGFFLSNSFKFRATGKTTVQKPLAGYTLQLLLFRFLEGTYIKILVRSIRESYR